MQLLQQYPAGSLAAFPTKLMYCPAATVQLSSLAAGLHKTCMLFAGQIAGFPARVAVDSQASHCFISSALVARAGIHMSPVNFQITLGDAYAAQVKGQCSDKFRMGQLNDSTAC